MGILNSLGNFAWGSPMTPDDVLIIAFKKQSRLKIKAKICHLLSVISLIQKHNGSTELCQPVRRQSASSY